jgi:ribosomal protein S18 acetylase RimI-like enzyme
MSYTCRLMAEDEFTSEFEVFVMNTFFQYEPMNKHLNTKIPDEIDLPWFQQVLNKAKYDNLSLAFYDPHYHHSLPIAYAINHHDRMDDHDHSDILYSSLNKKCFNKYEHIIDLITKLHENINLFEKFHSQNLFHIYLLGVDPIYRQNKLASQLLDSSICLAKEKKFDIIYADVTSDYSLNAFLKYDFQVIKTIDYNSYENLYGEKIFQNIQIHKGCSIVIKDLRIK